MYNLIKAIKNYVNSKKLIVKPDIFDTLAIADLSSVILKNKFKDK
jgi:hypothetical protein